MLSQPIFDDRNLSESFYTTLFKRLCESFDGSTQALFSECTLGIAPCSTGENTFFIVAPSMEIAEQLIHRIERIQHQIDSGIVGIEQTAICIQPPEVARQEFPPKFMVGKIFRHPLKLESQD